MIVPSHAASLRLPIGSRPHEAEHNPDPDDRFAGFEVRDATGEKPLIAQGRDREEFDAFYRYATEIELTAP